MESGGYRHSQRPAGESCLPLLPDLVRKPQFLLRIFSILFAVIVLAILAHQVDEFNGVGCVFISETSKASECFLAISVASLSCVACIVFLVLDYLIKTVDNEQVTRCIQVVDLSVSVVGFILWFVSFCYAAHEWQELPNSELNAVLISNANAALAFSFFSLASWLALVVLAWAVLRGGFSSTAGRRGEYSKFEGDERTAFAAASQHT